MKMVKLLGFILVVVLLVPVLASCTGAEASTDPAGTTGTTYVPVPAPKPVVVTKTVPVPVPDPDPKVVVVPRHTPASPAKPQWHWPWHPNWHWPWHPRP